MRKIFILTVLLAGLAFSVSAQPAERSSKRVNVIVDNDLCGDGDGLFHLVHQLLCGSSDVKGIVGAHLGTGRHWGGSESENKLNNAEISVSRANEILDLLGMAGTTTFEPGAASSFYEVTKAPHITETGLYDFSKPNRNIIVYKTIDTRLLFSDMESRFRLATR